MANCSEAFWNRNKKIRKIKKIDKKWNKNHRIRYVIYITDIYLIKNMDKIKYIRCLEAGPNAKHDVQIFKI